MQAVKRRNGAIELDLGRYELRRHGRRVKLEKKPMEPLIFMVSRREQLVSRNDLVTKLWRSDRFIDTEPNINNIVRKIRTALGNNSTKPRFLEAVVGKGYRFIGPVMGTLQELSASCSDCRTEAGTRAENPGNKYPHYFAPQAGHDDEELERGESSAG